LKSKAKQREGQISTNSKLKKCWTTKPREVLKSKGTHKIARGIDKFLTQSRKGTNEPKKKHMNQERCQWIRTHELGKVLTSKSTWTKRGINEHEQEEASMNKKARPKTN
jgi:hypothetical protein